MQIQNLAALITEQEIAADLNMLQKLWKSFLGYLPTLIAAIIVLIVGMIISKLVLKSMKKRSANSHIDKTTYKFLQSLIQVVIYMLVIVTVLSVLGVPMASIIAVIASAGVAVGLAVKDSLSNVAGGFIILFTKPFKIGDYVTCCGESGTVESISIIYTRLLTIDNRAVYIPNGQITTSTVINYNDEPLRRLDLEFSIAYEADFEKAKTVIAQVIADNKLALSDPAPLIRVCKHDASAIVIAAKVWVEAANYWDLNFDLYEQVKAAFDANGITIPFNQLDVHVVKE